jgi:hypothetical protein
MKPMPKRPEQKIFQWRIIRIKASPAAVLGHVNAPDAEQAIKEAIGSSASRTPNNRSVWQRRR